LVLFILASVDMETDNTNVTNNEKNQTFGRIAKSVSEHRFFPIRCSAIHIFIPMMHKPANNVMDINSEKKSETKF
jgi:hypothetical protein